MRRRAATGGPKKQPRKRVKLRRAAKMVQRPASSTAKLQEQVKALRRELDEARAQQTATSEVLKVISSSPGELEPVFETILANAVRICEAKFGNLHLCQDGGFPIVAQHGAPARYAELRRGNPMVRPNPGSSLDVVARTRQVAQVADVAADPAHDRHPIVLLGGARSLLNVPMLKDDVLVGVIGIYHQKVRPFTDKQIELVQNFAAQAVIAIENTRLLNELRESLQQQTATADVLKVISSSPTNLQPIFGAIAQSAVQLCEANNASLYRAEGNLLRHVASHGGVITLALGETRPVNSGSLAGRSILARETVHILDSLAAAAEFPDSRDGIERQAIRTALGVPLLRGDTPLGTIVVRRTEVRPFTEKQIALLKIFADQAVIAIENANLFNELRQRTGDLSESLEQQTATSEVLRIISSSPGELEPVFNAMLANATRLCEAAFGAMAICEGDSLRRVAVHNPPPQFASLYKIGDLFHRSKAPMLDRVMQTKDVVRVADLAAEIPEEPLVKLGKARSVVTIPMLKEGQLVGGISIYRQEVRPFSDKQIELVRNFAAQAVIAIENARLLNELRESLQQQTATSDVLKVISRSAFDLQAVLDTLVGSAADLCRADRSAIRMARDGRYHNVASHGYSPEQIEWLKRNPYPQDRGSVVGRVMLDGKSIHVADAQAEPEYNLATRGNTLKVRTVLGVPLLREGAPVGALILMRNVVQPFTDQQIALVNTFADQAVIAIENVRLFDEVQKRTSDLTESLEQQTATSKVLEVISRAAFDLQAVFETVAESCVKLCGADRAFIFRFDGELLRMVASFNSAPEFTAWVRQNPIRPGRHSGSARAALERRTIHIPDVRADPEYSYGAKSVEAIRTILGVPILKGDELLGVMMIYRLEVRPFTDKQIALVETFADQAAIAIENVRLFDEIQDKSRQLAEASRHKSQFLANMSHELRTPLNAILGYTELIADGIYGDVPAKALDVLKRVESNGQHLLGLINDVLDFSKIEAGEFKLALDDYSIKDVVYNVFSAVEPLATKKNLKLKVDMPPEMPAARGDERKLTQVLLNLVGNAIKFTDSGEVAIKAAAGNGSLSVAVHDTGPGIDPANQAKLFEEFQQADNSITKAKGGTGLGLAIARRIVELHGGRLWVESRPGDGATFTFKIPVLVEQQARPS